MHMFSGTPSSSSDKDASQPKTQQFKNSFCLWFDGISRYTPVEGEDPKIIQKNRMTQMLKDLRETLNKNPSTKGAYRFEVIGKMEGLGLLWTNCSKSEILTYLDSFFKEQRQKGIHLGLKDKAEFRAAFLKSQLYKSYQDHMMDAHKNSLAVCERKKMEELNACLVVPRLLPGSVYPGVYAQARIYFVDTRPYNGFSSSLSMDSMNDQWNGPAYDTILGTMPVYSVSSSLRPSSLINGTTTIIINNDSLDNDFSSISRYRDFDCPAARVVVPNAEGLAGVVQDDSTFSGAYNSGYDACNITCVDTHPSYESGYGAYGCSYGGVFGSASALSLSSNAGMPPIVIQRDSNVGSGSAIVHHSSGATTPSASSSASVAASRSSSTSLASASTGTRSTTPGYLLSQFHSFMQSLYNSAGTSPDSSSLSTPLPKESPKAQSKLK